MNLRYNDFSSYTTSMEINGDNAPDSGSELNNSNSNSNSIPIPVMNK